MKNILKNFAIIIVLTLGGFLFLLSNHIGGFRAFTVMSASMEPRIATGAIVITQSIFPKDLAIGDVIIFLRPGNANEFITHRVNKKIQTEGLTTFKTKGDNNQTSDRWIVAGGSVIGKVIMTIPYLGYVLSFSQTKIGIALFILIPAFFILLDELNTLLKLFTNRKKKSIPITSETAMIIFFMGILLNFSMRPSPALLSDSVSLSDNQFTVSTITTPTSTQPSPSTITETPIPTAIITQILTPTQIITPTQTKESSESCKEDNNKPEDHHSKTYKEKEQDKNYSSWEKSHRDNY